MSNSEKKVTLRFEVADAGASQQMGKLAENATKAATKDLRSSMNSPTGEWGGYAPPYQHAHGFPSMAGGFHAPNVGGGGFNAAALAGASYRDPAAAFAAIRVGGGVGAGAGGVMNMAVLTELRHIRR
jgi:hypothetical protein